MSAPTPAIRFVPVPSAPGSATGQARDPTVPAPHRSILVSSPPSPFPVAAPFTFTVPAPSSAPSPAATSSMPSHAIAHKSAHHLHSIPPREKSTRTLILDHMLWQLTRARFAQARAELGMPLSGGPEADEDDPADESDGEGVEVLAYRTGGRHIPGAVLGGGDAVRARQFRGVADGHERVLGAMLEQPPEPSFRDGGDGRSEAPERLPNGVRLRLALASLTNELFSRDVELDDQAFVAGGRGGYPPSITSLMLISTPATPQTPLPTLPSFADLIQSSSPAPSGPEASTSKPSIWNAVPRGLGPEAPWAFAGSLNPTSSSSSSGPVSPGSPASWPRLNIESKPTRAQQLYRDGATGEQAQQCVRHLTTCNCSSAVALRGAVVKGGTTTGRHIGAGLRRPGNLLMRKPSSVSLSSQSTSSTGTVIILPTARLTDLLPRFLRLSALVAIELGREASATSTLSEPDSSSLRADTTTDTTPEPSEVESTGPATPRPPPAARPSKAWYGLLVALCTRACLEGYLARGWRTPDGVDTLFGLGVGLGSPTSYGGGEYDSDDEEGAELEPDGWPGVEEAARVLFPFSTGGEGAQESVWERIVDGQGRLEQEEFELEMKDRHAVFLNVPNGTDLRTHLVELAQRWPPEPMERAALRFCEAVSRWRGKSKLHPSRSRAPRARGLSTASTHSTLSITSLINPPAPRELPIEHWFVLPTKNDRRSAAAAGKRKREGGGEGRRKGPRAEEGGQGRRGWVEAEEWIGPYGIPYGQ